MRSWMCHSAISSAAGRMFLSGTAEGGGGAEVVEAAEGADGHPHCAAVESNWSHWRRCLSNTMRESPRAPEGRGQRPEGRGQGGVRDRATPGRWWPRGGRPSSSSSSSLSISTSSSPWPFLLDVFVVGVWR